MERPRRAAASKRSYAQYAGEGGDESGSAYEEVHDDHAELSFEADHVPAMPLAELRAHLLRRGVGSVPSGGGRAAWESALLLWCVCVVRVCSLTAVGSEDVMRSIRRKRIAEGNAMVEEWLTQSPLRGEAKSNKSVSFCLDDNDEAPGSPGDASKSAGQ